MPDSTGEVYERLFLSTDELKERERLVAKREAEEAGRKTTQEAQRREMKLNARRKIVKSPRTRRELSATSRWRSDS